MKEISLGQIGVPAKDGTTRFDMAVINDSIYKVEVYQNRSTFVKCVNRKNVAAPANQDIVHAIKLWAENENFFDWNLQHFIKKMVRPEILNAT